MSKAREIADSLKGYIAEPRLSELAEEIDAALKAEREAGRQEGRAEWKRDAAAFLDEYIARKKRAMKDKPHDKGE